MWWSSWKTTRMLTASMINSRLSKWGLLCFWMYSTSLTRCLLGSTTEWSRASFASTMKTTASTLLRSCQTLRWWDGQSWEASRGRKLIDLFKTVLSQKVSTKLQKLIKRIKPPTWKYRLQRWFSHRALHSRNERPQAPLKSRIWIVTKKNQLKC